MAKRFSLREFGLLIAPVLVVGAVGFWASKRPPTKPATNNGKLGLTFQIDKPTALEAFDGAQGAFVLGLQQPAGNFRINGSSTYLELQTPRGPLRLRQGVERKDWGDVWHGNINGTRFPVRISEIPQGGLSFGSTAIIDYGFSASITPLPPKPWPMKGRWKINRAQLKAQNLAAMPHQPLVTLRSVTITRKIPNGNLTGEAIFHLDGAAMSGNTIFDYDFNVVGNGELNFSGSGTTRETPRTKVREWNVSERADDPSALKVRVTGRVSADNRWPLGFEIEPFDFKSAKVGQKLRFKQFPVALPKP